MAKSRKRKPINQNLSAYLFLMPWIIGFLVFVLYPLFYTIVLSFNNVVKDINGWNNTYVGIENYITAFVRNTNFTPLLIEFIIVELSYVPAILVLSLILAILLNTKIKFRAGFRLIFFFPVVVMSGPVLSQLGSSRATELIDVSSILVFRMIANYSDTLAGVLIGIFNNFSTILWFTGIPIVLFLNGLQKINSQLFEAAQIDGANSWQMLWKISLPNLKSTALVVGIFTVVQIAIFEINPMYAFIIRTINDNYTNGLGFAAAVVLVYSLVVLLFIVLIFFLLRDREKDVYKETLQEKQQKYVNRLKKQQHRHRYQNETIKEFISRMKNRRKEKNHVE